MQPFVSKDLFKMRWAGNPSLSPDGRKLLYDVTEVSEEDNTYYSNVYLFDGRKHQVFASNHGKKNNFGGKFSPNGRMVAFLSNRENGQQIWLKRGATEAKRLTDAPAGISQFLFSPDNRYIYYLAKEKKAESQYPAPVTARRITTLKYKFNGTGFLDNIPSQIYRVSLRSGKVKKLTSFADSPSSLVISQDGLKLVFAANFRDDEQNLTRDIYTLDLQTDELKKVTDGKGFYTEALFLPDGDLIIVGKPVHPAPGTYPRIYRFNESGTAEKLSEDFPYNIGGSIGTDVALDRGSGGISYFDGNLYFPATTEGSCYLYGYNLASKEFHKIYGEGQMAFLSYSIAGGKLAINKLSPLSPGDLHWGELNDLSSMVQITDYNAKLFKDKYIGVPESHYFEYDGVKLQGWIIKPKDFDPEKKHPWIMQIHGGPHMDYGPVFSHEFQMLAGAGFGIFFANPRGSMSYGEDFSTAVVGDWCGVDARDLEFLARELIKFPYVDAKRLCVTGGSQGGYFTNWLISHTDLFSAAVTQRSMSNLYTKYGIADNGWNGDRFGMGGADLWTDEDFIMERSPIRYAPNVNTPLLIIHSDEDYRCPLEQGEQWYVALKRLGNITEMLIFHGENHNLSRGGKPANRIVRLDAILDWFQRYS